MNFIKVGLVQPPKPLRSPNVVGKKENIRVADRIEKDLRVEQKVDEAVRNLILADQTPTPPKFTAEDLREEWSKYKFSAGTMKIGRK